MAIISRCGGRPKNWLNDWRLFLTFREPMSWAGRRGPLPSSSIAIACDHTICRWRKSYGRSAFPIRLPPPVSILGTIIASTSTPVGKSTGQPV